MSDINQIALIAHLFHLGILLIVAFLIFRICHKRLVAFTDILSLLIALIHTIIYTTYAILSSNLGILPTSEFIPLWTEIVRLHNWTMIALYLVLYIKRAKEYELVSGVVNGPNNSN